LLDEVVWSFGWPQCLGILIALGGCCRLLRAFCLQRFDTWTDETDLQELCMLALTRVDWLAAYTAVEAGGRTICWRTVYTGLLGPHARLPGWARNQARIAGVVAGLVEELHDEENDENEQEQGEQQ